MTRTRRMGVRAFKPISSDEGIRVSDKRVARLMKERSIHGASRRKGFKTTIRDRDARPAPDLVNRKFTLLRHPINFGLPISPTCRRGVDFLFVAIVLDVYSRRVVGWAMATHLRTELVLDALNMAIYRRNPAERDSPFRSRNAIHVDRVSAARCKEANVRPSMGSVGDCYDNAMCESFNAILECELLVKHRFKTPREASLAVFDFIEGFYNPRRRHTSIGFHLTDGIRAPDSRGVMSNQQLSAEPGQLHSAAMAMERFRNSRDPAPQKSGANTASLPSASICITRLWGLPRRGVRVRSGAP